MRSGGSTPKEHGGKSDLHSILSLYTFCSTAYLCNAHLRSYDLPLRVPGDLTVKHDGLFGADVDRGSPDAEGECSRLCDEMHTWIVESEPGRMHGKGDPACLPRDEGEASKTEQHAVGTGDRGNQVAAVELHHLVTRALSRVVYLYRYLDRLSGTLRLHGKVTVSKRSVAQTMSKGKKRARRRVDIIAVEHRMVPSSTQPNVIGNLADRARHAHRQAAARICLSGEYVGQTAATFFSWWKHLQQRVRSPGNGSKRVDAPAEYHHHKRLPCLGKRLDQFLLNAREIEAGGVITFANRG